MKSTLVSLKRRILPLVMIGMFLSVLSLAFVACSDGSDGNDGDTESIADDSKADANVVVCTYYQEGDSSNYYIFYADKTAEGYVDGKLEYSRSTLSYTGSPTAAGTLTLKTVTGVTLLTFTVTNTNGNVVATVELVPGFETKYTVKTGSSNGSGTSGNNSGSSNGTGENTESKTGDTNPKIMFMGFDNVVTIPAGATIAEIQNQIFALTSDTTVKMSGGINAVMLNTIISAMNMNNSVQIALDLSDTTGITEWKNWFAGVETIYAISLPNTVTTVQDDAFKDCTNLKAITVPCTITACPQVSLNYSSYTSYGNYMLNFAGSIDDWLNGSFEIPNSVWNFYLDGIRLIKITEVTIPSSITAIKNNAFRGWSGLTNIMIPKSVTSIGSYAFYGCSGLTKVTIPGTVSSIGDYAFANCAETKLVSDESDNSEASEIIEPGFGSGRVWDSEYESEKTYVTIGLTRVTINNGVKSVGSYAFSGCKVLTIITMPNSVTSIGNGVFYGCSNLASVWLPDSITSIGDSAFSGCTNLTTITIPNGVTSIEAYTFYGCTGLMSIGLPDSVTSIGASAFYGCTRLTSFTILGSVTGIKNYAFADCSSLKQLNIEDGDTTLEFERYGLFSDCPLEYIYLGRNLSYTNYYSPFSEIETLTSVEIGDSVTTIGRYAFEGCTLESLTISDAVTSIEYAAFADCNNLTTINYRGSESQWAAISIGSNNAPLTSATIIYNYTGN